MRFTPAFSLLATAMLLAACNDNSHTAYTPAPEGSQTLAQPSAQPVTQPPVVPAAPPVVTPPKPIKIGVVSDVHIFDQSVLGGAPGQSAFDEAIANDRKSWIQSPAILDAAIDKVVAAGNKILLITGDLTKDGEQADHERLRTALTKLRDKGITVLVIPGNHDMNNPYGSSGSIYFEGNSVGATTGSIAPYMEHVSGSKQYGMGNFDAFYADYGFNQAFERDSHSFSYVVDVAPGVWVMALDIANSSLEDAPTKWSTTQGAIDYNETAGSLLSPERQATFAWAKQIADRAKAEGKVLLTMSHFGGVEHFPGQNTLVPGYVIDGNKSASYLSGLSWDKYSESYTGLDGSASALTYDSSSEYVSRELAKAGINLLLTGHFHANDIAKRSYSDGSHLIDVQTGSTVSYPAPWRQLVVDPASKLLTISTDNSSVQEAVPDAKLEQLVDDMASNLLTVLGMDVTAQVQQLLDALLLKQPLWNVMVALYQIEHAVDAATASAALQAALPSGVSQSELAKMTLTSLIAKTLKVHYYGNEAESALVSSTDRYAVLWAKGVNSTTLANYLGSAASQLGVTLPTTMLAQFAGMVPLFGVVGEGIFNDPTPDLAVQINLATGELTKQ